LELRSRLEVCDRWRHVVGVIISLLGGLGLFLLGMVLLTDGLKAFAGDSLRRALLRFTGKPVTAFASGALVTALIQSSSATTLTTIGFVSAGLLSFSHSVGLVMGASLGTTSTGWLVSVVGLKFSITNIALPLICAGAFARLLAHGRLASLGIAVAGFGVIFVGIDQLQLGMAALTEQVDLSAIQSTGLTGHLLMMGIGILLTVLMQSSSAAVATTLTALHSGAIGFEQAASLVIGAAIGTTVTAALAAIGASTAAKRTALAHILFNLGTGLIAVILLPVFLWALGWMQAQVGWGADATGLAAFHTSFIAVGVLVFFPFIGPFTRLIERILPERGSRLGRHLDAGLFTVPAVAMEAARECLRECATVLFQQLQSRIQGNAPSRVDEALLTELEAALQQGSEFIARIPGFEGEMEGSHMRRDAYHALDHLAQLAPSAHETVIERGGVSLQEGADLCGQALTGAIEALTQPGIDEVVGLVAEDSSSLANWRKSVRRDLLESKDSQATEAALQSLDDIRRLDRIAYHAWRIAHYLRRDRVG